MFSNIKAARLLGRASFAVGATELCATRWLEKTMGVDDHATLIRAYGLREIAAGFTILNQPGLNKPLVGGLWSRVLGDVVDLASLGAAAKSTRRPEGLAAVTALVLAVTGMDVVVASVAQCELARASKISAAARARVQPTAAVPNGITRSRFSNPNSTTDGSLAGH